MDHYSTWGHPPSKREQRHRAARRNIIMATALIGSVAFAFYADKAWGTVNHMTANPSCPTEAC